MTPDTTLDPDYIRHYRHLEYLARVMFDMLATPASPTRAAAAERRVAERLAVHAAGPAAFSIATIEAVGRLAGRVGEMDIDKQENES